MTESIRVKINGAEYEAKKGEFILEAARRNQILIPSLCHHEALPGLGCCRLCVVEVNEGGGNRVVVSCVYPLAKDCEVWTESDTIKRIRRGILSMLRGRAPESSRLASLCRLYGVPEEKRYTLPASSACVLCGLCTEACSKLGTGAISSVGRGTGKKISTPYDEASPDCIGCGSCAAVCPTAAIECTEADGVRTIWGKTFTLVSCENCGRPFASPEELAHSARRMALEEAPRTDMAVTAALCDTCRRKRSAGVLAAVYGSRV